MTMTRMPRPFYFMCTVCPFMRDMTETATQIEAGEAHSHQTRRAPDGSREPMPPCNGRVFQRAYARENDRECAGSNGARCRNIAAEGNSNMTMTTKMRIEKLESWIPGLGNDARYWDLRRTYGNYSDEVARHLEACARYQRSQR